MLVEAGMLQSHRPVGRGRDRRPLVAGVLGLRIRRKLRRLKCGERVCATLPLGAVRK